ncbi:hypothetical protein [Paenarthrobacter sp. YJN-5]|uniref:hypothetical protein n=1 Tax=Paenarthrobacter sp. YJN-5 TaxID=2735316 RepID=UPI0018788E50|nr:hypothetical protein [Paenarthrobacter sp. YJN-5]QOT19357.1 hypothetical protein HMI59_22125 [Paenarthrobacter sp. YJN-5]
MNPSPSPTPVDVFVHTAPPADWQVLAAFAPLLAAVIAALIAGAALWQKWRADNRAEWWRRAQWALDASMSNEPKRAEMGQQAINLLGSSKLATPEDGALLKIGTEDPLEAAYNAQLAEAADNVGISDEAEARLERVDDPETRRDNEGDNNDDTGR